MGMPRAALVAVSLALTVGMPSQSGTVETFFRDYTAEWVRGDPNQAAATRYFVGEEQQRFERQLTALTPEWRATRVGLARKGLDALRTFDHTRMTDMERLSADVMRWQLDTLVQGERYADYSFPLEQFSGANVSLVATLTVTHPMATDQDATNYVARLRQVSARIDEASADARRLASKGLRPPRFILQATAAQMKQFISMSPAENPFVATFEERMKNVTALPEATRKDLLAQAQKAVSEDVYPAWRRAIALLESLMTGATDDAGLWRLQGGADAYRYALYRYTTTTLTADQIHAIGLQRVAALETQMDAVLRRLGRTSGSVNVRIAQLKRDLAYPLTDAGRGLIMADVEQILRDGEARATTLFNRRPRAPVVARPFPRFRESSAAGNYTAPAPDGSRPGVFQIPLRPERMTKFALRSLVYHETVPGHHFQHALELEDTALPQFRRIRAFGGISALGEGWALYAEHLAAESGWYDNDLEGLLGELDSELFRARRLVVDTGLHAKHWTRQQAIDYGIEPSEVERYVVNPGQACSYMIGELKIIELRERAKKALGDRFSAKGFHDAVLATGTVPLEILERQVDAYIRTAGSLP